MIDSVYISNNLLFDSFIAVGLARCGRFEELLGSGGGNWSLEVLNNTQRDMHENMRRSETGNCLIQRGGNDGEL